MFVLYVLMRNDLASMNAGKAVAQGTHAANQCVFEIENGSNESLKAMLENWQMETGHGFGTCIVLGVNGSELYETVENAKKYGFHAGITHDPSYPLMDGQVCHLIPLDTCGFVFGDKDDLSIFLSNFNLLP